MSRTSGGPALREQAIPLVCVVLLATVPGLGFGAVFLGWGFAWIPLLGAVTGTAAGALAIHRRLLVGESIAVALGLFVVVGAVAVGGATPTGATTFLRGVVTGWAELLTSFTPVRATTSMSALPFVVSWFGAVVGVELLRTTRAPALPALGPLIAFAASLLFTVEQRGLALTQGVVMVLGTLGLGLVQQRQYRTLEDDLTTGSTHRWSARGLATTGVVLTLVLVGAPAVGPQLPLAEANERFDLRRYLVPPFDPLAIPSPLTGIKGQLKEERDEELMFTVHSTEPIQRWTTAALGTYDGIVWTVAESLSSDAGRYTPVDELLPPPPEGDLDPDRTKVEAEIEVASLDGVWAPRPGWVTELEMPVDEDVRFNAVTGNVALPDRLQPGLRYRVRGIPLPSAAEAGEPTVTADASELATLPPAIRNLVADIVQGEDPGWPQIAAIVDQLTNEGFYDVSDRARPGHSFFRLGEFLADPERIVGYEEQYAAAAAVAVRALGRPARVVVGYLVPEDRWEDGRAEVYSGDVSAWIEVRATAGWVAIDVTPDRAREPDAVERGRTVEDIAVPNPPPPPPPPPDRDPPEQERLEEAEAEEEEEAEELAVGIPPVVLYAAAGVGSPVLLLLLLALVLGALKARRRERRRHAPSPALRVAGAWLELLDRCFELGHTGRRSRTHTTREVATVLAGHASADPRPLATLADQVDRAAFHPRPPSNEDAATAWDAAERTLAELATGQTRWTRLRTRLDPRPLLRRDPTTGATA